MKNLLGLSKRIFLCAFLLWVNLFFAYAQRDIQLFNFDWKFRQGNFLGNNPTMVDSLWKTVNLPHDASISGEFSEEKSNSANGWLPQQMGWYRKHFTISPEAQGKFIYVEFEGVYRAAEVWINGYYLGKHLNGYLGFECDLTPFLNYGSDNVLAVKYDNSTPGTSRWYTGEGIYRNVWLKILSPVHVPQNGTYVSTSKITQESATVKIKTKVSNFTSQEKLCRLVTEIVDKKRISVAAFTSISLISSNETFLFDQDIDVIKPKLWSTEDPYLYTVVSKVYTDDRLMDTYETTIGIREIRMMPNKGLLVNGKKVVAKGGNLHHDLGCLGAAAFERGYEKRLENLKAMGCNSIRLSHNPHAPALLDLCDKMGILVISEAYDKWTSQYYGGEVSFESSWKEDITSWIERDRNHASIYLWSVGNEVPQQLGRWDEKFETPAAANRYGVDVFVKLKELVNTLDPTRPVTCVLFPARAKAVTEWDNPASYYKSPPAEMAWYMDVVSTNYMENMFQPDHAKYPQMKFLASEVGTNLGYDYRKLSWLEIDTTFLIGHYFWSACTYLGESSWPAKGWDRAFYDASETLTPIGSIYQSFYSEKPMVHVWVFDEREKILNEWNKQYHDKRWSWYPMRKDWNLQDYQKVKLATYTNCDDVELFLNGKSFGRKKVNTLSDHLLEWEIPYSPGILKAVGRIKNKVVAEQELKTSGFPLRLILEPDRQSIKADGLDLAYVLIRVVDEDGVTVPNADRLLRFKVGGAGEIAAVSNGNINSEEKWKASERSLYNGECLLVVRSARKEGRINIVASCDGLPEATCVVFTEKQGK